MPVYQAICQVEKKLQSIRCLCQFHQSLQRVYPYQFSIIVPIHGTLHLHSVLKSMQNLVEHGWFKRLYQLDGHCYCTLGRNFAALPNFQSLSPEKVIHSINILSYLQQNPPLRIIRIHRVPDENFQITYFCCSHRMLSIIQLNCGWTGVNRL